MLVHLSSQAKQLDGTPEVWDTGGQRVLLETAPADVLLVRVVLRAPSGARARAKVRGKERQEEEEAGLRMQCPEDGRADALRTNGAGPSLSSTT